MPKSKGDAASTYAGAGGRIRISAFPLKIAGVPDRLLVLQDLSYGEARAREVRFYSTLALIGAAAGFGLLTVAAVLGLTRGWTRSIRDALAEVRRGGRPDRIELGAFPINKELGALLAEFRAERKFANGIHVEWSPETLHQLLAEELPGAEVLIVSNREPYIHTHDGDQIVLQIPASGLVAALEPVVMRACGGAWIAHGSGSADRQTVDATTARLPPDNPTYSLRRVWLREAEQDGYYYGFANEGHVAALPCRFRAPDVPREGLGSIRRGQ